MGQSRDDLTGRHLKLIENCDLLVGGKRLLALFDRKPEKTLVISKEIAPVLEQIKKAAQTQDVVVLGSGDPLFHGIGATLRRTILPEHLVFHPNVSSVAAAYALIKEPWQEALLVSLHGKNAARFPFGDIKEHPSTAFLTDPKKNPVWIARHLLNNGFHNAQVCVLESIGNPEKERITWFDSPRQMEDLSFTDPNIVIVKPARKKKCHVPRETYLGMDESEFVHQKGLITKSEIRSVSLSKLKLAAKDLVLWDIGAGSGSVSMEAAVHFLTEGKIFAFEKKPDRIKDIKANAARFGCKNVHVSQTPFPEGADDIDRPDRIFIGGGGRGIQEILSSSCARLKPGGIIVVNTVLLQTLEKTFAHLENAGMSPEAVQIQVSRTKGMPFGHRFNALNPVWIISGSKPDYEDRS